MKREVDLSGYLKQGKNEIAILVWYFGKEGFSHKSSGKAGLLFEVSASGKRIVSDGSWWCRIHPAYGNTEAPYNEFVLRPIPQWKDFGVKGIDRTEIKVGEQADTIAAYFPYNLQMTSVLDITDPVGGNLILSSGRLSIGAVSQFKNEVGLFIDQMAA